MQKNSFGFLALAGVAAIALPGSAGATGARRNAPVTINLAGTYAAGAFGYVHNNGGGTNYIGCNSIGTRTWSEVICYAHDDYNQFASCFSYEPNLIDAVSSITSDGHVSFSWMSSGECYNITVTTDSRDASREP